MRSKQFIPSHRTKLLPFVLGATCALGAPALSVADEPEHTAENTLIEEVIVWGSSLSQKGTAMSAAEGLVGYSDFSTRPLSRVGELVEVVPGMVATQHSGEGKANQYFLRGVNLDHGTDFSAYFEGMPVNFRSHAHGHGYLDLNFIIPEIVSTVRYQKGPYAADRGDFSTVGTTAFRVYDSIDRPFVQATLGEDGYQRVVTAGSIHLGHGHLLGAVEVLRDDGPWELEQDLKKNNVLLKYSGHWGDYQTRLLLSHYDNEWQATDQVPQRLVRSGAVDRFGFIDPTVGGDTSRTIISGGVEGDTWEAGLYYSVYDLNLFSNFTYFADDPVNGDQIQQVDDRAVYGGFITSDFDLADNVTLTVGGDWRVDDISKLQLNRTNQRVLTERVRDDEVMWRSYGAHATLAVAWTEKLRTELALRADYFDFDVDAALQVDGGDKESNLVSSISVAYELNDTIELYANWGQGFHSNDVRGVFSFVDPGTGTLTPGLDTFADQTGSEIGVRLETATTQTTVTVFQMKSDSELLFVGDAGNTEASDGSRRTGVEFGWFWTPSDQLAVDLTGAVVNSRFTGVPGNSKNIPNSFGEVFAGGVTWADPNGLEASLRVRHFGDAPIIEDGSREQDPSTIVNLGLAYNFGNWELGVDVLNVFDTEAEDITYFFESQVAGEVAPVEDFHFHPVLPRTVRAQIRFNFGEGSGL